MDFWPSCGNSKEALLYFEQWQYCTSYRMIYFLYEVNCCFLSILLHKYLILCFFTSYSREITIQKYFSYLVSFSSQMNWFLTIPIIFSLYSLLHAQDKWKCHMQKKEYFLGHNLRILRVNNASTSFFTLFHSIEFIFTAYFA